MQRPFHAFSWVCEVAVSVYYGKTPSISGTLVTSYHSYTLPGNIFIVLYSIPLLQSRVSNKPRQEFHNVMFHVLSMKQLCFFNVHSVNPQVMLLMWAGHFWRYFGISRIAFDVSLYSLLFHLLKWSPAYSLKGCHPKSKHCRNFKTNSINGITCKIIRPIEE